MSDTFHVEHFETPALYSLTMVHHGTQKMKVIKILCDLTGQSLAESKKLLESCPFYLLEDAPQSEVLEWKNAFTGTDAALEVRPSCF